MTSKQLISHLENHFEDYRYLGRLVAQFLSRKVHMQFLDTGLPLLHLVEHRAKSLDSLRKNSAAGRHKELSLQAIADLAGVRVIFYFKDDCDSFAGTDFKAWFGQGTEGRNAEWGRT